jgi:cephalosporin hydroxylase
MLSKRPIGHPLHCPSRPWPVIMTSPVSRQSKSADNPSPSSGSGADTPYLISDYLVRDLRHVMLKVAANEGWFRNHWLGVPIWQLPDDLMGLQQAVTAIRPGLIIETGTKFGGCSLFFASMLALLGLEQSRVITIDITPTAEAEAVRREQGLARFVSEWLVGSSLEPGVLETVAANVAKTSGPVLVFLDDWHDGDHVLAEIRAYQKFVGRDGLLIVADTSFADLAGTPVAPYRSLVDSNPRTAIASFLAESDTFERCETFLSASGLSNFADGYLRRKPSAKE